MEGLSRWNNYFVRARMARELKLCQLVDRLESGASEPKAVSDCFDRVYYGQLLRDVARQKPELAQFDGMLHSNHVAEFRHLDKERLTLAKYRTLVAHFERLSPHDSGVGLGQNRHQFHNGSAEGEAKLTMQGLNHRRSRRCKVS
jgi:hypothetical protein